MKKRYMLLVALLVLGAILVLWNFTNKKTLSPGENIVSTNNEQAKPDMNSTPTSQKVIQIGPASSILELVECIEKKSCVPQPEDDLAYYNEKATEPYLKLKELMQIEVDEPTRGMDEDLVFRIIELKESDSQILAVQNLLKGQLQKATVQKLKNHFVNFTNESARVVLDMLSRWVNDKSNAGVKREDLVFLAASWLKGEENSPIDFLESSFFEKLDPKETQEIAKSLCYVEIDPKMSHLKKYVSSKINLEVCAGLDQ
jgi:hypothetical protein